MNRKNIGKILFPYRMVWALEPIVLMLKIGM